MKENDEEEKEPIYIEFTEWNADFEKYKNAIYLKWSGV